MSDTRDTHFAVSWQAAARRRGEPEQLRRDQLRHCTDEDLARAVARGDDTALDELMQRYEQRLEEFIRWSLDDAAVWTEDVLQEVFLQVHRSAVRFAGQSSFKTWLYGLTRNVCRHEMRKLRRQPSWSAEGTEAMMDLPMHAPSPLEALTRDEARRAVRDAVASLPASHRIVMMLRDWEDLSYAEIAEVLDLPIGTVRSRLHNARALLAQRLEGLCR